MKKTISRLFLSAFLILIILVIPNSVNAAKVKVGKVKSVKIEKRKTTSLKLKWKKVSKATGYKIYVYDSSKNKYKYFGKTTSKKYTLKNLKTSKKYKIKIRAYRTVNKKDYNGPYSSVFTTTTKPAEVKSLKVTFQSDASASLEWNKVARASGYKAYIYNDSTKQYEEKIAVDKNFVSITGLAQSKTYKVKVRAYKKLNNKKYYGAYSEPIDTFTKPTKVVGLKAAKASIDSITLTWNAIPRIVAYAVYKYDSSTKQYKKLGETSNNQFTVQGLNPATGYDFKVRGYIKYNDKKFFGSYSDSFSTATLPNKISDLKVSTVTENSIKVKWSKVDKANGYAVYVYRDSSQSFKLYKTTTSNTMNITDLMAAKFYKIYVKAYATINGKAYYSTESNTVSHKTNSTETEIAGIDVSVHNGKINWEKVKKAGVDFAILRCGFGQDYKSQDDKKFAEYVAECERLQIPYGVYLYSYALNTKHAISEAEHALRLLKGHTPKYGIWFDMEDADKYKQKKGMPKNKVLVDICATFCDKMIEKGYKTGIYASLSWFNNKLKDSKLDKYDKWVAQWNDKCGYTKNYIMWQYTSSGMVDGIKGRVDMNIMYIKIVDEPTQEPVPTEPVVPEQPSEPSNPTEPVVPTQPTDPVEPTNPTEPETTEKITESDDSTNQTNPTNQVKSNESTN